MGVSPDTSAHKRGTDSAPPEEAFPDDLSFAARIEKWYRQSGRDLPWRHTRDAYPIWLSEIILQQTRVEQGRDYWHRFTERYPSVEDLARASEDEVMHL